jgi:hypothetical protein
MPFSTRWLRTKRASKLLVSPLRPRVLLILLPAYLCGAALIVEGLRETSGTLEPDVAVRYEQRLAKLRPLLHPNIPVAGYISDRRDHEEDFLPQYVLAPTLLIRDVRRRPQYLVANFDDPANIEKSAAAAGYEIQAEFPDGVILFVRKPR